MFVLFVWFIVLRVYGVTVSARFIQSNDDLLIFNVYDLCDAGSHHVLWESISSRLSSHIGRIVFVCGDFNAVRGIDERRSVGSVHCLLGGSSFNSFTTNNYLVDLPLIGRQFTWYRGDGHSMSRLDFCYLKVGVWGGRIIFKWPSCVVCLIIVL